MQNASIVVLDMSSLDLILRFSMITTEPATVDAGLHNFGPNALDALTGASQITGTPVIAQQFDQDFFASSGEILSNFVESGQIWALLIGLVFGYLIRGLTTY